MEVSTLINHFQEELFHALLVDRETLFHTGALHLARRPAGDEPAAQPTVAPQWLRDLPDRRYRTHIRARTLQNGR